MLKNKKRFICFVLLAWTVILHSQSLGVPFFWDDLSLISENAAFQNSPILSVWTAPILRADSGYYRPIPFSLIGVVGKFTGFQNPVPFHLVTLFFVCLAALIFFQLALRFFSLEISVLITLMFVSFPTNIEAFAWLSALPDVMALVFGLLFFMFVLDDGKRTYPTPRLALVLILGLLSKESTFILLPFAVLFDWRKIKAQPFQRILRFHAPLWAIFAGYYTLHSKVAPGIPELTYSLPLVLKTLTVYAKKIVNPFPLLIVIGSRTGNFDLPSFIGLVIALAAAYGIFISKSEAVRLASAAGICAFIPYSNFWMFRAESLISERYMLLMVAASFLLAGVALTHIKAPFRFIVPACLALIYFGGSWIQYGAWQDERQLWVDAARENPEKYTPFSKLAEFDAGHGNFESAKKNFDLSYRNMELGKRLGLLSFKDSVVVNFLSLGQRIYFNLGDFDQALKFARLKFQVEPSAPLVIGAMQIHDHRLDYAATVSAAVNGAKKYPNDGALISESLRFAALGGQSTAVKAVLASSTYPEAATVAEYYTRMYESMATMPSFVRGGILANMQVFSLAFREFDTVSNGLSADQDFLISKSAYQEHLWKNSLRYIELALKQEEKTEYKLLRGMALQRLGREDEACQMLKQALLGANADEHARIMSVAATCELFKPD